MEQTNMVSSRERQGTYEPCKNPRDVERPSGNIARTSQAPQRIPTARPGKVIGPVLLYESASVKDAYDPRRFIRNPVLPPQPGISPAYCFHNSSGKLDGYNREPLEAKHEPVQHKPPQPCLHNKMAPDVALDMRASPFYLTRTKAEPTVRESMIEASLVQAKSPYNGLVAAAAASDVAHRKVGAVQCGMTKMY